MSKSLETRHTLEFPRGVEEWIAEIESCWENIPEFKVDPEKLKHLAIICDGNRRAAKERKLKPYFGHQAGIETIKGIARACRQWNIHTLTFWLWSTENWEREKEQIEFIMNLGRYHLKDEVFVKELQQNQVRFTHLGRKDRLPSEIVEGLEKWEEQTASFARYRLNLAIDYGGEDEIARAVGKMFEDFQKGEFNPEILKQTPQAILGFLDAAGQAVPDLVIRTGVKEGEIPHTSGFMPLQTIYSGWVFLSDLFPDLTPRGLLEPIQELLQYERRFGR